MPVWGDGIDASTRRLSTSYWREKDLERGVDRAAELDELDRAVQVDVVPLGQLSCGSGVVPRPLELLSPPAHDAIGLGLFDLDFLSHSHVWCLPVGTFRRSIR